MKRNLQILFISNKIEKRLQASANHSNRTPNQLPKNQCTWQKVFYSSVVALVFLPFSLHLSFQKYVFKINIYITFVGKLLFLYETAFSVLSNICCFFFWKLNVTFLNWKINANICLLLLSSGRCLALFNGQCVRTLGCYYSVETQPLLRPIVSMWCYK